MIYILAKLLIAAVVAVVFLIIPLMLAARRMRPYP